MIWRNTRLWVPYCPKLLIWLCLFKWVIIWAIRIIFISDHVLGTTIIALFLIRIYTFSQFLLEWLLLIFETFFSSHILSRVCARLWFFSNHWVIFISLNCLRLKILNSFRCLILGLWLDSIHKFCLLFLSRILLLNSLILLIFIWLDLIL